MTEPTDPAVPPPPPYGAPPPPYGAPAYGGYGPPPGQRINDPAPMGMRLLARIIDLILVGVVAGIVAAVGGLHVLHKVTNVDGTTTLNIDTAGYFKLALVVAVITVIYEVVMLSTWGATLGKKAVGVRVAMLVDGSKPDAGAAFVRSIIPAVSAIIPFLQLIMYLSPFFDSTHRNRGWYDYAAKTIAVRTK